MKKILLGTTALFGAAFAANVALADAPKITLGGVSEFQLGHVSQDNDANQRNHNFRSDNEISVKVDGKTDGGLGYGAEIWLEADVEDDADLQGTNASKTFLYLDGTWGRVEMGSTLGPDQTLKIGAESIARATGGIDGDFTYFVTAIGTSGTEPFLAKPDLPVNYGGLVTAAILGNEQTENLNKIVYYTPKWNGFQAGISYAVDVANRGQTVALGDVGTGFGAQEDIFQAGVNWSGKWDAVTIGLAATGEWGDSENTTFEDIGAWTVGAKLGYMGWSFAASYGDWGDSLQATAAASDDAEYWTLGAAYEWGAYGVSVTYFDSEMDSDSSTAENSFDNLVIGADYKMAPGFTPYIEASFFDQDRPAAVGVDNNGHVLLVGSQLNF